MSLRRANSLKLPLLLLLLLPVTPPWAVDREFVYIVGRGRRAAGDGGGRSDFDFE